MEEVKSLFINSFTQYIPWVYIDPSWEASRANQTVMANLLLEV